MKRKAEILDTFAIYLGILIFIAFSLFPFAWMISTSFKDPSETFHIPPIWIPSKIPTQPTWPEYGIGWFVHYQAALGAAKFDVAFANSLFVSVMASLGGVALSCLAGYSFSRFKFPGNKPVTLLTIASQMFPSVLFLVPYVILLTQLGLTNTYPGLVLTYLTFTIPFNMWMLKGIFDAVPIEIEESAMIDGCSRLGAFVRTVLPLAAPGIGAAAVIGFLEGWNELMFASALTRGENMWTMPVALAMVTGRNMKDWNVLVAASVVSTIPALIFFVLMQRQIVRGLTAGAVKG